MNIIILGPQGSGKGTQAELIAEKYRLFYYDAGKYLREIAKSNKRIDNLINKKGMLLPDDEIFNLTKDYLEEQKVSDNILFDGYPRSIGQYDLLKDYLSEKGTNINHAIFLEVSEEVSVRRLTARRMCKVCGRIYNLVTDPPPKKMTCECGGELFQREDDKPEAIRERLELYKVRTQPLIEVFRSEGILMEINGERPVNEIFDEIVARIGKYDDKK